MNSKESESSSPLFRSVLIRGIPPEFSSLPALLKQFQKYGHIDSVRISGDQAVIIYSSRKSAAIAVRSPHALSANRFVEISLLANGENGDLEHLCDMELVNEQNAGLMKLINGEKEKTQRLREELKMKQTRDNTFYLLEQDFAKLRKSINDASEEEKSALRKKLNDLMEIMKESSND